MRGLLVVVNFNQSLEVENFLKKLLSFYPKQDILFVDDGSTDGSREIAEQQGYNIIAHKKNLGVGAAIRTGIFYAHSKSYDFVVINSSNGKMRPEDLSKILTPILNNQADYCTGSRFVAGGSSPGLPLFRKVAIPVFTLFLNLLLQRRFSDITCGYRAYTLNWMFKSELNLEQEWLNRYEMEYYIHYWACRKKLRIQEVPVSIQYQHLAKGRHSKIRPVLDWWLMIRPILFLVLGVRK